MVEKLYHRGSVLDMPAQSAVFLHGIPGSARTWDTLIVPAINVVGHACAPTLPGFGGVPVPDGFGCLLSPSFRPTIDTYARWLGQQLDEQDVQRAHLVMHDFGGPVGLAWGAAHPDRLASLTCINTGILTNYRWNVLTRIWRKRWIGETLNAVITQQIFELLTSHHQPRPLPRPAQDQLFQDFPPSARRNALALYRATHEDLLARFADSYRELDPPTLVLWGAHDPYRPVHQAHWQHRAFPSAKIIILDGSGHWPHLDNPHTVAQHLIPFLTETASNAHQTRY
jgi:pimeloyl-ACP methyl ester carboxylesterase